MWNVCRYTVSCEAEKRIGNESTYVPRVYNLIHPFYCEICLTPTNCTPYSQTCHLPFRLRLWQLIFSYWSLDALRYPVNVIILPHPA